MEKNHGKRKFFKRKWDYQKNVFAPHGSRFEESGIIPQKNRGNFSTISDLVRYTVRLFEINKCELGVITNVFEHSNLKKVEILTSDTQKEYIEMVANANNVPVSVVLRHLLLCYIRNDRPKKGIVLVSDWWMGELIYFQ